MMLATDAKNKDKIISSHFLSGYATTLRIATLPWSIQWQSTVLLYGATVLKPASLTLPSTTPCELWLDACILHQQTTFLFLQASSLLSFFTKEQMHGVSCKCMASMQMHGVSNQDTHLYPPHNNSSVHLTTRTTNVRHTGRITKGMRSGCATLRDSALPSSILALTLLEWPSQEQPGSVLFASVLVLDASAPACTNGVWPPVACECGAEEHTINHVVLQCPTHWPHGLHKCTAWWFWTMRQLNGCSTPMPRSSAVKQWLKNWLKWRRKRCRVFRKTWYSKPQS